MDRLKILAIVVVVIAVVAGIGIYLYPSTPPKINITYSSKYGDTQASNYNTYILFYLNVTTTKNCQFDFGKLQLTSNGQPIAILVGSGSDIISLKSGQINSVGLEYTVKGDVTGNFQLVYNGTDKVTLNGLNSVPVQS